PEGTRGRAKGGASPRRACEWAHPRGGPGAPGLREMGPGGQTSPPHAPGGNPEQGEAGARAAKSPRWSVARRAFPFSLGTQASRTRRRAPVMARRSGCLAGTRAPVGAPHPLEGWKRKCFGDVPKEKGEEEDEVGEKRREIIRRMG